MQLHCRDALRSNRGYPIGHAAYPQGISINDRLFLMIWKKCDRNIDYLKKDDRVQINLIIFWQESNTVDL